MNMRICELWVKALVGENDGSIIVAAYCDIFPRAAGRPGPPAHRGDAPLVRECRLAAGAAPPLAVHYAIVEDRAARAIVAAGAQRARSAPRGAFDDINILYTTQNYEYYDR